MEHMVLPCQGFFLGTGFSHAAPFTNLSSHSTLHAQWCGAFFTPLPTAIRLCYGHELAKDELEGSSK